MCTFLLRVVFWSYSNLRIFFHAYNITNNFFKILFLFSIWYVLRKNYSNNIFFTIYSKRVKFLFRFSKFCFKYRANFLILIIQKLLKRILRKIDLKFPCLSWQRTHWNFFNTVNLLFLEPYHLRSAGQSYRSSPSFTVTSIRNNGGKVRVTFQ